MKKFLFLVLVVAFLFASCGGDGGANEAKDNLKKAAEALNGYAPYEVDYMTTLVSCEFDGKKFVYSYEIDEDYRTVSEMKESGYVDEFRASLQKDWDENPELKVMKENLNKIGGSLIYEYRGNTTGEVLSIVIDIESVGKPKSDETKNQVGKVGKIGNLKLCR